MRFPKVSVLGLALLAGACAGADPSHSDSASAPGTPVASETVEPDPFRIPVIEFRGDAAPQPPPPDEGKAERIQQELEDLQGIWVAVDIQHDGARENPPGGLRWVFQDDRYEVWIAGKKHETWSIKIDPTQRPATIFASPVDNPRGPRLRGIYALDDNTLKLCYDLTGKEYPAAFAAPKGARRISYVFERD